MKAALFELTSWMGTTTYLLKSKTVPGLIRELEKHQELACLVTMGKMEGDDPCELEKLSNILEATKAKRLTFEDLEKMDIHLTPGSIKCLGVADDDDKDAFERLEVLTKK